MTATEGQRRAVTLDEFFANLGALISPESVQAGLALEVRPTDVFISPFPKCGTTWLQQIVHSLRTGGDLDFDDISRVVPWVETAADLGIDLDADQRAEPRAFKSHLTWDLVPKGGRYIVTVRDSRDVLVSAYRFMGGWLFETSRIDIETYGRGSFLAGRGYWTHLASWWPHRHDHDVLMLAYEHMKDDLPGTVRRMAEFIGLKPDAERLALACEQASLESMTAHKDKYDDRMMRERSVTVCNLPPGGESAKVRTGRVGGHRDVLGSGLIAEFDAVWQATVGAELGLPDYGALLAELRRDV